MNVIGTSQIIAAVYAAGAFGFALGFVCSALLTMMRRSSRTPK